MKYQLQTSRHAKHLLHVHFVVIPKYRKKIFTKEHIDFMGVIFSKICEDFET